ncbi:MAG: OmpA family protein [Polyangiaceae bacterium]|nr:OmpA family protein [Polyangiaceae bacterium]
MNTPVIVGALTGVALLGASSIYVERQVSASKERLENPEAVPEEAQAAVADHAEAEYCTPKFREVLARVVQACGLGGQDARRGCEPVDVRSFASISDDDFNALFDPLVKRGAIVLFDDNSEKLDDAAKKIISEKWDERKGARYFFVVARASKTGTASYNEQLSQKRANSVFFHLEEVSKEEKDLDKKVGMLWLGSQYAQLKQDYCGTWQTSRPGKSCNDQAINRSAFVSWVDCRL